MLVEVKTYHILCRLYDEEVLGHTIHSAVVVHSLLGNGWCNINHPMYIQCVYMCMCMYIYIYVCE